MQILLTGISGQVGGALLSSLGALGKVIPADRAVLDLSRPDTLPRILDRLSPDVIINPAAYTAVDQAEVDRELAYLVNAHAPDVIAQWAAANGVPFVHFSTEYVFDGSGKRPWREDDPVVPISIYGASKLAGEEAIRRAAGIHLIVRTSWVFSVSGKNFLTTIMRLAREQRELRVVADQMGAPTSARSIAWAVTEIISQQNHFANDLEVKLVKERLGAAKGLLHLCSSGETSWHGFASAIVDESRSRGFQIAVRDVVAITSHEFPTRASRPLNSRMDMTRLHKTFGIRMPEWRASLSAELDQLPGRGVRTIT